MHRRLLGAVFLLGIGFATESAATPEPVRRVPVRVLPNVVEGDPAPSSLVLLRLRAVPYGAISGELPADAPAVETSGTVADGGTLELRSDWFWRVEATTSDYWAAPILLSAPLAARDLPLRLLPAATLTGRLSVPEGQTLPAEFSVGVEATPELVAGSPGTAVKNLTRALPSSQIPCPVLAGHFRCLVPAGTLDLALRAEGFISHYRWGLPVKRGALVDVGTVALERGAAVSGWVVVRGAAAPTGQRVKVELQAQGRSEAASPVESARLASRRLETTVDARGFFHLTGVLPGGYTLTATKEGFAPAVSPGLQVFPDRETRLVQPIELAPPLTATLWLTPEFAPNGEPWRVELGALRPGSNYLDLLTTSPEPAPGGQWRREGLTPGRYKLRVSDSSGASYFSDDIEWTETSTSAWVTLDVLEFEGRVLFGDEPLPGASVTFGGRTGAVRIEVQADDEGAIRGVLPKDFGPWPIDIEANNPPLVFRLAGVEVSSSGAGPAQLTLRVPKTELRGHVVTEDGRPGPGSAVDILPDSGPPVQLRTREDGSFEARGLAPGRVEIEAWRGRMERSEVLPLEIVEGRTVPPVRLVLRATRPFVGTVRAGGHPVAGARISAAPLSPTDRFAGVGTVAVASSGVDGNFRLELPAWVTSVQVRYGAPGFTYGETRFATLPDHPIVLPLAQDGGTLRLTADTPLRSRVWLETAPWLFFPERGLRLPLPELRSWSQAHGLPAELSSLTVPNLPPGKLTACWFATEKEESEAFATGSLPAKRCSEGWLAPGGEVELTLVSPRGQKGEDDR